MDVSYADEMVRVYSGHHSPFNFLRFMELRQRTTSFSDLIAEEFFPVAFQPADADAVRAAVRSTSGNLFSALGKAPALGRLYARNDDRTPSAESEVRAKSACGWR